MRSLVRASQIALSIHFWWFFSSLEQFLAIHVRISTPPNIPWDPSIVFLSSQLYNSFLSPANTNWLHLLNSFLSFQLSKTTLHHLDSLSFPFYNLAWKLPPVRLGTFVFSLSQDHSLFRMVVLHCRLSNV